jgi:hypothetical protein
MTFGGLPHYVLLTKNYIEMTKEEEKIWELVHKWCNEQSYEIPDFNRRVLMERILALCQQLVIKSVCNIHKGTRCEKSFPSYTDGKCRECGGQAN